MPALSSAALIAGACSAMTWFKNSSSLSFAVADLLFFLFRLRLVGFFSSTFLGWGSSTSLDDDSESESWAAKAENADF